MEGVERAAASPFLKSVAGRLGRAARLALIFGVGSSALGYASLWYQARTPSGFWVDFNLDEVVVEDSKNASGGGGAALESLFGGKKKLGLRSVVEAIDEAKTDKQCKAILVRSTGSGDGGNEWLSGSIAALATMQEIRSALVRFSAAKKESFAFWNTFGELGTSNGLMSFTFATSCNHVSVMPSGHLSIMGLAGRSPFFKGFLDKWKIQFYTIKRNQYKNALNNLTENKYTSAHRQATEHLLETLFNQCVHDISESLGMSPRSVTKLIDDAPISAIKAKEANLIGSIRYQSAVIDEVAAKTMEKIKEDQGQGGLEKEKLLRSMENLPPSARAEKLRLSLDAYIKALQARKVLAELHSKVAWPFGKTEERAKVAVVYLNGPILNGNGGSSTGSKIIDSRESAKVLRRVGAMKAVKAIVLRVNSPGGSVVGSDEIWSAVRDLQSNQKKVVISMGNLAASGGYYISAPADRILASPATLTGSIGVIFGKINFGSFLEEIVGIKIDETRAYGKNALMMSQTMDFSRSQKRRLNAMIDEVYEEFLRKVSEGRGMSAKMARKVANGRVWTGEDAYRLGLVDKLGGLVDAIAEAKAVSGLPPEAQAVEVRAQVSIKDQLRSLFAAVEVRDALLSLLVGTDVGVARAMAEDISARPALVDPTLVFL